MNAEMLRLAALFVAACVLWVLLACAETTSSQTSIGSWEHELLDVYFQVSAYLIHVESLRDSLDFGVGRSSDCDPRITAESHAKVSRRLEELLSSANEYRIRKHSIEKLKKLSAAWMEVRKRQLAVWTQSGDLENSEPRERCMRPSALSDLRLEIDANMKAVISQQAIP